jgi:hypothetical protein
VSVLTVAASMVPHDINAVSLATRWFTGDSVHVGGTVPHVPSAAVPKPLPDLRGQCVPPGVPQHRFQNGVWQHVMLIHSLPVSPTDASVSRVK